MAHDLIRFNEVMTLSTTIPGTFARQLRILVVDDNFKEKAMRLPLHVAQNIRWPVTHQRYSWHARIFVDLDMSGTLVLQIQQTDLDQDIDTSSQTELRSRRASY
jgi:hypothetical protein